MAVLDPNEVFFTPFEPKQQNRFVLYVDGFPAYLIKGLGAVTVSQGTVNLNHINIQRNLKGKTTWGTIALTLFDAILCHFDSISTLFRCYFYAISTVFCAI